jgi:hypothetical protein
VSFVIEPLENLNQSLDHPLPGDVQGDSQVKCRELSRKYIVNRLNYINFTDGSITVNLKHVKYDNIISVKVKPQPCLDGYLDCLWGETSIPAQKLKSYQYKNIIIPDKQKLILVEAELQSMSEAGIRFYLPEVCHEISSRRITRHNCEGINVQLIQNGAIYNGNLLDFNAVSFKIAVVSVPPQTFQWINREASTSVILSDGNQTLFTGECRILKQTSDQKQRLFVLEPLYNQIKRFKSKKFRSERQELLPSPNIIFNHPLTKKSTELKVVKISGSGFSVEEEESRAVLLAGMIIPELELSFAHSFTIRLKAQVVYSSINTKGSDKSCVICGLAIIDMDIQAHVKLLSLLQQANDSHSYLCNKVDVAELWNFFFESGFVYPQKYMYIKSNKEKFMQIYKNLYTQNPSIARHFIYQDNGTIHGHMAMIRYYENTWLIHHHAARKSETNRAGLSVLNQLSRSIIDCHGLYSAHMNFLVCYFRPDNKFPNRIFGGVAKHLNDPKACSIDVFAYYRFRPTFEQRWRMCGPWELLKTQPDDLVEMQNYYEFKSGGLMINALDLEPYASFGEKLSEEYQDLGFTRERHLYSLKKNGELKAVFILNKSNIGLNMSELTNCIKIIILEPCDLSQNDLNMLLSLLSTKYEQEEVAVLIYPVNYLDQQNIAYDKLYKMFIINTMYSDEYFDYLNKYFRFVKT